MRKDKFLRMTPYFLPLLLLSLEVFILDVTAQEPQVTVKRECQSTCGNVTIPFPFGIGEGCYLRDSLQNDDFAINCNLSADGKSGTPFLMSNESIPLEVLDISIEGGTLRVSIPILRTCGRKQNSSDDEETKQVANLNGTPFFFSQDANMLTGLGCRNLVYMSDGDKNSATRYTYGGCFSLCDDGKRNYKKDDKVEKKGEKNYDDTKRNNGHSNCTGINCCQTRIASFIQSFSITTSLYEDGKNAQSTPTNELNDCRYAFLVEQNWTYSPLVNVSTLKSMPVVLDWGIDPWYFDKLPKDVQANCNNKTLYNSKSPKGYEIFSCACRDGYEGNPYLENGCTDIDECKKHPDICGSSRYCVNTDGNYSCNPNPRKVKDKVEIIITGVGTSFAGLFLLAVAWWIYIIIKRRKIMKRKKEFFKRNGGLLLEKQLISSGDKVDRCKLFCSDELDKATDDFNKNRILGQGGQGTVYKGMLADGRIIAVKKSKVIDEVKLEEFVNEVDILSQINHRNVVKLLGCCLETEVPLLVYEFIPNGTLYMYIHNPNEELEFTWDMRLRIATEVAEALSYLHSAASVPIYHRDIKSTNILLDEMLRAKVADFGTSKSFSMDQTHVTTKVLGTVGYIDPEYFQSNQFTEKSDVYSFGVVLVELLTGENPMRQGKCGSLVSYFNVSMKEDHLYDILDAQIQSSGKIQEIMTVASLAQRCLNLNGRERPSMKEIAMVLEKTRASQKGSKLDDGYHCEEIECIRSEIIESWDMVTSSTSSTFATNVDPSTDDQPLMAS